MSFGKLGTMGRGFGHLGALGRTSGGRYSQFGRLEIPNIAFSNTLLQTYYFKREEEAPFDSVRLRISNVLANGNGGFTAAVASTETILRDTVSNRFRPIVGGTEYNSYVSSGPGWRAVTWGGQAASGNLAAGNVLETYVDSDIIACPSYPRADGAVRPLLLIRVCSNSPVNGNNAVVNFSRSQIIGDRNDIDYSRVYEVGVLTGSDGVATLTNEPVPPSAYFRTSSSALLPLMAVDLFYRGDLVATEILNPGDSVSGGVQSAGNLGSDGQDGWIQRAVLGVSTPDMPFKLYNIAQSGQTSATFIPAATAAINAGLRPKIVLIPTSSRNDGYGANSIIDTYYGRVDTFITLLKSINPKPQIGMWLDPPKRSSGASSSEDSVRFYGHSLAQARLASGAIDFIVDTNTPVAVGSPQTWDTADNLHPANGSVIPGNPATPLLAAALKSTLRPTFGPLIARPASFFTGFSFSQVGSNCRIRPSQVQGSGTIGRSYAWTLNGVSVGSNSVISPTWAVGDIGKVPVCVETVTGDGSPVTSTVTFPVVVAAASNLHASNSNTFTSYLSATDVTFAQNVTDPFGNANTAWTATEGTTSAQHGVSSPALMTFTSGTTYLIQMYAYFATGMQTCLQLAHGSTRFGVNAYANFDLANARMGTVGSAVTAYGIQPCEEMPGWFLCWLTAPCTSSGTDTGLFKMSNGASATRAATYTGTSLTQRWFNGQICVASGPQAPVVT